jgi:3-dehydroquinate synthase
VSKEKKLPGEKIFFKKFGKELSEFLLHKKYSAHFILVDDNTVNHCLPILLKEVEILESAAVIEIFSGETFKNIDTAQAVWEKLTELHADRNAVLINLGGGMVCDLGGFAAATYKRGIDFIHVPTTLLSQADAAYGGKQGIDFLNFKNQVGIFKQPAAIFVNTTFLKTLPDEQLVNGFAEVVKHGLLAGGKLWKQVVSVENMNEVNWKKMVADSAAIKLEVVHEDPFEKGLRKILNFGHTIGHAIETHLMNTGRETPHGFCIAAGMIGELFLSSQLYGFPQKKLEAVTAFIHHHFPDCSPGAASDDDLLQLMKQDKKNRDGKIQFVLLKNIGEPVIGIEAGDEDIKKALQFIRG